MKQFHRTIEQFAPTNGRETRSMEAEEEENDSDYIPGESDSSVSESLGDSDEPDNESVDEIPRRLDGTPAIAAWKALMGGIDEPQRDILGRKRKIGRESNKGNGRIKKSPRSKERLTP